MIDSEEEIFQNYNFGIKFDEIDNCILENKSSNFVIKFYTKSNLCAKRTFYWEPKFFFKMENKENIDVSIFFSIEEISFYFNKYLSKKDFFVSYYKNNTLNYQLGKPLLFSEKKYIIIVNKEIEELEESDICVDNLFQNIDENDLIDPLKISKQYFYYNNINYNLRKDYIFYIKKEKN